LAFVLIIILNKEFSEFIITKSQENSKTTQSETQ